jgi:hypothetical protein
MSAFILGIRTPVSTTVIPASARTASGELSVPVPDQISRSAPDVLEVHEQVPGCLDHPGGGRVRGGAQDADPPRIVLDHR